MQQTLSQEMKSGWLQGQIQLRRQFVCICSIRIQYSDQGEGSQRTEWLIFACVGIYFGYIIIFEGLTKNKGGMCITVEYTFF